MSHFLFTMSSVFSADFLTSWQCLNLELSVSTSSKFRGILVSLALEVIVDIRIASNSDKETPSTDSRDLLVEALLGEMEAGAREREISSEMYGVLNF